MRAFRARRPHLAHAARVALVATLVIAVVYVVVAGALDAFLGRRVLWEVDQRLGERLSDVSHVANPLDTRSLPDDQGTDGAPIFLWWLPPSGSPQALTEDSPSLPVGGRASTGARSSASSGGVTYRLEMTPFRDGWLVAGQNLAGPSHIDRVLFTGELVIGPALLLAVFVGVLGHRPAGGGPGRTGRADGCSSSRPTPRMSCARR